MTFKVVILTGPRPQYGFCPVPPLTDSAPEKNLYRLSEHDFGEEIQVHVVSACGQSQAAQLQSEEHIGNYHWVVLPDSSLRINHSALLHNWLISGYSNRLLHTPDLMTRYYLDQACKQIRNLAPDLILINSFPQYIRVIHDRFPKVKLGLFVRGEMGDSRKYLPLLDLTITNSDGITDYVRHLLNNAPVPIYKIPNTLDSDYCTTPKQYLGRNRIIYTGRMDPVKGVLELVFAFKLVQKQIPDAQLTIVGGNFGQTALTPYEQKLVDEVEKSYLNVKFISQVPNIQLPKYYQQADLAVFPSIYLESFGMVALEAMRCGLPVMASRRPGFEELIINGETGVFLDDPENIDNMAQSITQLLQDPELLSAMGRMGYQRSLDFIPEKNYPRFKEIISECLSA